MHTLPQDDFPDGFRVAWLYHREDSLLMQVSKVIAPSLITERSLGLRVDADMDVYCIIPLFATICEEFFLA